MTMFCNESHHRCGLFSAFGIANRSVDRQIALRVCNVVHSVGFEEGPVREVRESYVHVDSAIRNTADSIISVMLHMLMLLRMYAHDREREREKASDAHIRESVSVPLSPTLQY